MQEKILHFTYTKQFNDNIYHQYNERRNKNMNNLQLKPYLQQTQEWPNDGEHIMAHFDAETILVYQAYRSEIGLYAASNNRFGGAFSYNRMSWIKPNFLWMMYRSGWGSKAGQEVTLAITLRRSFFDKILSKAVASAPFRSGKKLSHNQKFGSNGILITHQTDHH
jgi:hypothetical protein